MEAYDNTKLTAELKSENVQHRNKLYYFAASFGQLTYM